MPSNPPSIDDVFDAEADQIISRCITASPPQSFFLSAGAGSGKTRSLVRALEQVREHLAGRFRLHGQHVGVVTFTNKACDEINRRLKYDPLFHVSTIHSFAWTLISGMNSDIREWLKEHLEKEIRELHDKQQRGRGGQASIDRQKAIEVKTERLQSLNSRTSFIYSPNGDNLELNALNHAEVIKSLSSFLSDKPLMQSLLVHRFPILLVDESQDTDLELMEALLLTERSQRGVFLLGIIGDIMQRIYVAGDVDLASNLPGTWATPIKQMNHRSGRRIVELINNIRRPIDRQSQRPRDDRRR